VKRDIVAKDCAGSIRLLDSKMDGDNYAIWDKNNDSSINIGHVEHLRLFLISNFLKDGNSENFFIRIENLPPMISQIIFNSHITNRRRNSLR
jgi:hypothetical protein